MPEQIALLGEAVDLTYKYEHLGSDPAALVSLAASPFFAKLKAAKAPAVVVGPGVLRRADRDAVLKAVHELVDKAGGWGRGWGRGRLSNSRDPERRQGRDGCCSAAGGCSCGMGMSLVLAPVEMGSLVF